MYLANSDYLIIVLSIFFWLTFLLLWLEKLHKFYFWLIMWFFFFVITNLHIKLLTTESSTDTTKNIWSSILSNSSFFLTNKSFILSALVIFIFVLWFMLLSSNFISFNVKNNKLTSMLFWALIPFFLISMLVYIWTNSVVTISFISDFFSFLNDSFFVSYLQEMPYLCLYFIYFLIFFRLFFRILVSFLIYMLKEIKKEWKKSDKGS